MCVCFFFCHFVIVDVGYFSGCVVIRNVVVVVYPIIGANVVSVVACYIYVYTVVIVVGNLVVGVVVVVVDNVVVVAAFSGMLC